MRAIACLSFLVLAACAKYERNQVYDHAACVAQVSPAQFNFGAPHGSQKSAVYDCVDVKGEACTYIWSLADRAVSVTDCEGPIVVDSEN